MFFSGSSNLSEGLVAEWPSASLSTLEWSWVLIQNLLTYLNLNKDKRLTMVQWGNFKNFNESRRPTFDAIVGVVLCKLMMTLQILEVRLGSTNTSQNLETSLNRRLEGNVQEPISIGTLRQDWLKNYEFRLVDLVCCSSKLVSRCTSSPPCTKPMTWWICKLR